MLITWELGGGLGHLVPIGSLAKGLLERDCEVTAAVRDLVSVGTILTDPQIRLLQAPHRIEPFRRTFDPPLSYAHMLHNVGFGSADGLCALVSAWRHLIELVKPDLVVCEHSPTALLACDSLGIDVIQVGTGFTIPPTPLPILRSIENRKVERSIREDEQRTLEIVNRIASRFGVVGLESLGQIYLRSKLSFLRTYSELDHFGERPNANYVGVEFAEASIGVEPVWPAGSGPRVFAYLKPLAGFREAERQLMNVGSPTIIYTPGLSSQEAAEVGGAIPSVRVSLLPLKIESIVESCDLVVCHGGHGLVSQMLLAGIPLVTIPMQLEQSLLCRRISQCAQPLAANVTDVAQLGEAIQQVLLNNTYRASAKQFSQKYSGSSKLRGMTAVVETIISRNAVID